MNDSSSWYTCILQAKIKVLEKKIFFCRLVRHYKEENVKLNYAKKQNSLINDKNYG